MRSTFLNSIVAVLTILPLGARAAEEGKAETVKRLGDSKHTLIDGIKEAEKGSVLAISAKFEFEDGKLWLSVYTAKDGKDRDAEHNTLMELKGEPNADEWKPNTEVFQDKEHIARSAMQLTLMQLSKMTLADVIEKASAEHKGTVYSAIPAVKDGKPVVVVLLATSDEKTEAVNVDLHTHEVTE